MTHPLQIGDRVAFTRSFIESGAVERRDRHAFASARGRIVSIQDGWLARVSWEGTGNLLASINLHNICRPRSVAFVESAQ